MKRVLSLLAPVVLATMTLFGEESSAVLPSITYRGSLVDAASEKYPSGVGKHDRMMTFRVYDTDMQGADALWTSGKMRVTINPDGSFEAKIGDENLAALIMTGTVTHVGLRLGESAEITPRRALRPLAAVTRAIVAESVTPDVKIGTLATSSAGAKAMTVSLAEISESLVVEAGKIHVEPFTLLEGESTRLKRGNGVNAFADGEPLELATKDHVSANEYLATAPANGVALVHCVGSGVNRIPGTIQFCRKGDAIRSPASASNVKVAFWEFAK